MTHHRRCLLLNVVLHATGSITGSSAAGTTRGALPDKISVMLGDGAAAPRREDGLMATLQLLLVMMIRLVLFMMMLVVVFVLKLWFLSVVIVVIGQLL